MNFVEWSKSSVDYGEKLVHSALQGAQEGEDEFLAEESLAPHIAKTAQLALWPAMIGAAVGTVAGNLNRKRRSGPRAVAFGLLGAAIGFGAGLILENREFATSIASGAWKKISQTRDEHWFEKHPIDYA